MIRRPVQLAHARLPLAPAPPPDLAGVGLDLALAAQNVERAHGDADVFRRALAAGTGVAPDTVLDRDRTLDLVAVAAWRAGALALRDDALARLADADDPTHRRALAATLGLGVDVLDAFVRRQRADRFWWPGRADDRGYVLAAGGFRGFGGAWIRPPERAVRLADAGAFAFLVAGEWWRLDADVWGARLAASDEPDAVAPAVLVDDGVSVVIGADTHLAWVHVREAA
ncbi:potassium transporter Kef [uncultured Microbacterium sp.]|uniref:potassium transporter Kef n=1 Tax=uncultured Microbacterium sp. TaxID=191216 RepID=UPI0028DC5EB6|nr:potassium transporter Kef [uncultured Microbacterium sp.]